MNNYKKIKIAILFLSIFFFSANITFAENFESTLIKSKNEGFITIKGKVLNKKTKKPIVFATISAKGTNVGTVTNSDGEFQINIEKSLKVKQLTFKYIGYKNKYVNISKLSSDQNIIYLEPTSIAIGEVVVRPENPKELIEKIIKKIPKNYSSSPEKMMAFYRETIKKRRKYVSVSEAVVEVYKSEYNKKITQDLVKLYKGRKSAKVKRQDTLIMKLRGGPKTALLLDIAKNPNMLFHKEDLDNYLFEIDEITNINDRQNYVIKFKQIKHFEYPLFDGKLYVDVNSLAITAAEFSLNLEDKNAASRLFVKKKPLFMSITPTKTKYFVKYTEDKGKYYFSHARGEVTLKCKWKRKVFNSKYTVATEIAITDKSKEEAIKFKRSEQLKSTIIFEEKVKPLSDDNFWGKYNTIKPEEAIENAIKKYGVRLKIQHN